MQRLQCNKAARQLTSGRLQANREGLAIGAGTRGLQRINMQGIESGDSWQNESTSARPLAPVNPVILQPTDASHRYA